MKKLANNILRNYLLLFAMALIPLVVHSQALQLAGLVRDSVSHEPLSYVAIYLVNGKKSAGEGSLTDDNGRFNIKSATVADSMRFSRMGYRTKTLKIDPLIQRRMIIDLVPDGISLKEVVVKPKKEKYSKKNNPAVDFLNRIRSTAELSDPKRNDYFNYDKYERITVALNDFDPETNYSWIGKRFKFLKDYVDVSDISGKPILNFMVKEKSSEVNYRKSPQSEKENVKGVSQKGVDDILINQDGTRQYLEDVLREINLYQNDITILQNRFVSPLSRIAPDFYKFYLTDTVAVDGDSCAVLSFVPRTPETWGFIGKFYVQLHDTTMHIKQVTMHLPHTINANFIDALTVNQTYEKGPDGSRWKTHDDMTVELSVLPGLPQLYVRRNTAYDDFNYNQLPSEEIFSFGGQEFIQPEAEARDTIFWNENRKLAIEGGEEKVDQLMTGLRKVPVYYWTEKTIKLFAGRYIPVGSPSKFDYGPIFSTVSYNALEGLRVRGGGMTTANLSKRWFGRGYLAYGFHDNKLKYYGEVEYSFIDKKYHSREFPVRSLRLTTFYDLGKPGQQGISTSSDDLFASIKRSSVMRVSYRRVNMLEYTLELYNNFSVATKVNFERQEATRWLPFVTGDGTVYPHYSELLFTLSLRYAPGEKFYQSRNKRVPINVDAPTIELSHIFASKGMAGSLYTINRTELKFEKRFWLSAFGYIDATVKGGHVWSIAPYMNLFVPSTNLSYLVISDSFSLLNQMEFINDTYGEANLTYWLNGFIFNRIPYFKKLKLREVLSFHCLWGSLSDKNNPEYNKSLFVLPEDAHTTLMGRTPYMEASVGVDNIFRLFRVDAVWRLSHRNTIDAPNWGIRAGFRLSF